VIVADDVSIVRGGRARLDRVSLDLRPGTLTVVLGPNGAGKSTLVAALAGDLAPTRGQVRLGDRALAAWGRVALARRRAVLLQRPSSVGGVRALEVALLGRAPHAAREGRGLVAPRPYDAEDLAAARRALARVDALALAERDVARLSGGERQRVELARVLAQLDGAPDPRVLLLDEPTSALDAPHQAQLLAHVVAVARQGVAALAVLHDVNLALAYADVVVLLAGGRLVGAGAPHEVLTAASLEATFSIPFEPLRRADGGWAFLPRAPVGRAELHEVTV
jgi:iron complex transport system ATP-binding protein